jgi:hypothetical protein
MVYPITGETMSHYKKSTNNPVTSKVMQTAFGKDFGGMASQGDNKTGQTGTNVMFVMTHDEIKHVLSKTKKSLLGTQLSIIGHRRRILTEFKLQWG